MTLQLATAAASPGSTLNRIVPAAVDLAIIVLLLVTRARGRPLQPARLLAGPLILIAIGIGSSAPELHSTTPHGIDYLIGGIDVLDSLIVGTIRGFTVRLYQRDGAPWYRYGPATIALWLLSILIRVGLAILGSAHHATPLAEGGDLLFMLGLALLCQNVVVVRRHALPPEQPAPAVQSLKAAGEGRANGRPLARRARRRAPRPRGIPRHRPRPPRPPSRRCWRCSR